MPAPMPQTPGGDDQLPPVQVGATGPGGSTTPQDVDRARQATMAGTDPNAAARAAAAKAAAEAAARDQAYQASYQYGGWAGGAHEAANRYSMQGLAGQGRQGETIDYTNALYDRGQAQAARGNQNSIYGLMAARAAGTTPSIAQMQADRQMQQAAAEQSSAAASARGPAGLALAQQGAAANTAAMQSNISGMAQINAANERQQAEQAAFQAATGMRGGDMQAGGMAAQQAQAQAGLYQQQRAQNDQYQLGMTGFETDVQKAQLQAQGNKVAVAAGQAQAQAQLNQAAAMHDQDRSDGWWKTGLTVGAGALGTGAAIAANFLGGGGASNSPAPGGVAGSDPGSGGTQGGYGGPGSTTGGYDSASGAPVAGTGGGFDPDDVSDVTAKQNIQPLGLAGGDDPRAKAWDEGRQSALQGLETLASKSPEELKAYGDHPLAAAVRKMKADAWDEGRRGPGAQARGDGLMGSSADDVAKMQAGEGMRSGSGDPMTEQLASGLAPSAYDYKPGMGTPGRKVGPMAQNMAANPITATAVRADPSRGGLMSIDRSDGLKVALGGVGHLAQRLQELEEEQRLRQAGNAIGQHVQAQGQGLLSQGPSVGQQYLQQMRSFDR